MVELCNRHEIGYDIVTPSGALFRDIGNVERMAFFEGYNSATNDAVDGPLNANRAWKAYKKEG